MVKKRLSRQEMAQQLREEAAELLRLADQLDASSLNEEIKQPLGSTSLLDDVIAAIGGKMMRKSVLAKKLNVSDKQLDAVMTKQNGFSMSQKGWWKHQPVKS